MTDELTAKLRKRAQVWASLISRKANEVPKPSVIRVKSSVEERGGKIGVLSIAYSTDPAKPIARAYEYGSGIHSTVKKRSKWQQPDGRILITPKKAKVLAFYWEKLSGDEPGTWYGGAKLIKKTQEGKAIFRYVEHPGVKAAGGGKGYLRPAIAEVRKTMRKEISKDVRDAVIGGFRKAFKQ